MFIVFSKDWRKQAKMIKKYQLVQASFFGAFTRENVAYQGVAYQIKLSRCIRNVRFLNIVQSQNFQNDTQGLEFFYITSG